MIVRFACAAAIFLILGGCAKSRLPETRPVPKPAPQDSPLRASHETPAISPPTLLASGKLPLVYLFGAGGEVRVLDRTTNTILLRTTARPNTIISVNSRGGVQVGTEKLLPGPLSEKDEYELWYIPPAR